MGRLARTVGRLHPLQIAGRAPALLLGRVLRDVPGGLGPRAIGAWPPPPPELDRLVRAEAERARERLGRLPVGSRLRAYESCYGMELGDLRAPHADWGSPVAVEPYPASVRARRIAVAIRRGAAGLEGELARAARAVLLRLEVHLLGNHLLENGLALVCAGAASRGLESDVWWTVGASVLAWQLGQQFLADGGHVERSASYGVALTAALLEAIDLAGASGRGAPRLWREVAARALGWAAAVRAPDGTYPLFNDASLDAAPAIDRVLGLGAALGLPSTAVARVDEGGGARVSRLQATGWVRLDVGDGCLIADAGPGAGGWQPGHAHADGLSFELWVAGRRAIVDFGVATYEPGSARVETRATRSHNTVELEDRDSCEVWGAFRVGRRGQGRVVDTRVADGWAQIELEHDGYAWLPGSPRHARSIVLGPRRLEVRDRLRGRSPGPWVSRLRVDDAAAVTVGGEGPVERRPDRWFPRYGDPRPALVFEQRASGREAAGVAWRVEW